MKKNSKLRGTKKVPRPPLGNPGGEKVKISKKYYGGGSLFGTSEYVLLRTKIILIILSLIQGEDVLIKKECIGKRY